jgi:ABC-type uncharacterized transport system YnjBCD ATPase subunit
VIEDFDRLTVTSLSRHYGRRKALSRVTFSCASGDIAGLLGPNGAGKSTLLAILGTLLSPSEGRVQYGDVTAEAGGAGLRARIGMLGHDLFLYPELTAHENLTFFGRLYGVPTRRRGPRRRSSAPDWVNAPTTRSPDSRAACGSVSHWSGRCCTSRGSSSSTSRSPGSIKPRPPRWFRASKRSRGEVC